MNSLATSGFFPVFGSMALTTPTAAGNGLPSLPSGRPSVAQFARSFGRWNIASSVEIVPSKSIRISFEWKALLSSESLQLIAPGGT